MPLLALLIYVYVVEIRDARRTGNWDAVIAGVTLFGADFVNESINGWIFAISGYSALWLAPGPTSLRTLVGWNVEIMFMFAIVGILYYKSLNEDPTATVLGLPNRWFWALFYSGVSVIVELALNKGGLLVWDYRWWNRGVVEVLPIFVFGYLWFYLFQWCGRTVVETCPSWARCPCRLQRRVPTVKSPDSQQRDWLRWQRVALAAAAVLVIDASRAADEPTYPDAFEVCTSCHSYQQNEPLLEGPPLWGVVGRRVASVEGYEYSAALRAIGGNWERARLDRFLTNPKVIAPGTKMDMGGVRNAAERVKVLDFLETIGTQKPADDAAK